MPGLPVPIEKILMYLNTGLQIVLLIKLYRSGLVGRYQWFGRYLVLGTAQTVWLALFATDTLAYFYSWLITEPIVWAIYFLIVLELYGLVLKEFEGLATAGRWALKSALAVALVLAFGLMLAEPAGPGEQHWAMKLIVTGQKTVGATLSIFLLGLTAFLAYYPVPLRRNVIVYCVVFFVFFFSLTTGMLVREHLGPERMAEVNLALLCLYTLCLGAWIFLLSPRGETARSRVPAVAASLDERQLLDHLSAINNAVLRSIKK